MVTALRPMPPITISEEELLAFGRTWFEMGRRLSRIPPQSSQQLGCLFDNAVGEALSIMLGGITVVRVGAITDASRPYNCVEVGNVKVAGGINSQSFDVVYRPDEVRIVFDSKTINDIHSLRKNWQNMVSDLVMAATTVHSRFPHSVIAFMIVIPKPCFQELRSRDLIKSLEKLARRRGVEDPVYMAEVISLVLWNPDDGSIDPLLPDPSSSLRLDRFSVNVEAAYVRRYKDRTTRNVALSEDQGLGSKDSLPNRTSHESPICFLSHSSMDKELVKKVASILHDSGIETWFDEWEILPGDRITEKIEEGMNKATSVVVFLSPHAVASRWVKEEMHGALYRAISDKGVQVIPVLLSDCAIPVSLANYKRISLGDNVQHIANEIRRAVLRLSDKPEVMKQNGL